MADGVVNFVNLVRPEKPTLTVVGSGITGLMTAWEASKNGYAVTVISQSPDPRLKSANENPQFSATFDGKDQRYVTLFEGHPYLDLAGYVGKIYPGIADDFMKHVLDGGFLALPFDQFSEASQKWLFARNELNQKLKSGDDESAQKIKNLFAAYSEENRAAMERWHGFLGELLDADPTLVNKISLNNEGIIRLYDSEPAFDQAIKSHLDGGVFKKQYSPQELAKEFPAYKVGVENEFIKGGSIEMYGLTLGVKSIAEAMIGIMDSKGVGFRFNKRVEGIEKNQKGEVTGLKIAGENELVKSKHYMLHPGALSQQSLYDNAGEVQGKIAAMEGYWITIDGAQEIIDQMGGKANKVHGKQSLESLLGKVDGESKEKFTKLFHEVGVTRFAEIAPIVDFNIMPIYSESGEVTLGVGSGYIFKGLPEQDDRGFPKFRNDPNSEKFVLGLMELWLEVLYGKELLLRQGKMTVWETGCKRSWTIDDKEVDENMPTEGGGVLGIRGGGNTGDTTKSTFVAGYNLRLFQKVDSDQIDLAELREKANDLRGSLRKKPEEVNFAELSRALAEKISSAQKLAAVSEISGRVEKPPTQVRDG